MAECRMQTDVPSVECRQSAGRTQRLVTAEGPEEANNVRQGSTALASISMDKSILAWCDSGLLVMREWVARTRGKR